MENKEFQELYDSLMSVIHDDSETIKTHVQAAVLLTEDTQDEKVKQKLIHTASLLYSARVLIESALHEMIH